MHKLYFGTFLLFNCEISALSINSLFSSETDLLGRPHFLMDMFEQKLAKESTLLEEATNLIEETELFSSQYLVYSSNGGSWKTYIMTTLSS